MSASECNELIETASSRFSRSTVQKNSHEVSKYRTSYSANLKKSETPLVESLEERVTIFSGSGVSNIEPLQMVKYSPGQFYKDHYDYFPTKSICGKSGQRYLTIFVYLNDDFEGGSTNFPKLKLDIKPKQGTALMFWNTDMTGKVDKLLLHSGKPVNNGTKYGLNIWVRQRPWVSKL